MILEWWRTFKDFISWWALQYGHERYCSYLSLYSFELCSLRVTRGSLNFEPHILGKNEEEVRMGRTCYPPHNPPWALAKNNIGIGVHRIFLRGEMRRGPQNLFNSWPQNNALLQHLQAKFKFIFWGGRSGPPKSLRGEIISLFSPPLCTPMIGFIKGKEREHSPWERVVC